MSAHQHEQIEDPHFRRAVDLLDAGDADGMRAHLRSHPEIACQRVNFEGNSYFANPALLEFAAENPVRHGRLPADIVAVARVVLDAGAKADRDTVDTTLALVSSGRVPRECGVQTQLIDLLCDHGADPKDALLAAIAHAEFEAVEALLRRGATVTLGVTAALGRVEDAKKQIPHADALERHRALAFAAQHGHAEIVRLLLDAGEDPNRCNPPGCHPHSMPLHQAAFFGHETTVRLLVERGARLDARDLVYNGTPLEWAKFAGRTGVEAYLQGVDDAASA